MVLRAMVLGGCIMSEAYARNERRASCRCILTFTSYDDIRVSDGCLIRDVSHQVPVGTFERVWVVIENE
jgi:hypothetical protein